VPAVAALMLGLTVTPAEIWNHPAIDAVYKGFDPNLVYANGGGSSVVRVSTDAIDITATPNSQPRVNLATTSLKTLNASLDLLVIENNGASEPFRIGVLSPWTRLGYLLAFEPQNRITAETIEHGTGATLVRGDVHPLAMLGTYTPGITYHLAFVVDKAKGLIASKVSDDHGWSAEASVDARQFPALFGKEPLSLSSFFWAGDGTSRVVLRNFSVTLPHERLWASKVTDPRADIILRGLAFAGLVLLAATIAQRLPRPFSTRTRAQTGAAPRRRRARFLLLGTAAIGLYLIGNALMFPLGGHPFDMGYEKLYAYVARTYGPAQLYFLPNVVSLAGLWGGVPYIEASFPYEPVVAYLFAGIGWLNSLMFAGGGTFSLASVRLEYVIKAVNVVFGLADTALIYLILRKVGVSERWSLIAAGIFLFNPAVWFSMSVWGQTHVISLFFVLAAVLLAEYNLPVWAWLALAAGVLTRPQMLVFSLLLGIVFLRTFTWRQNLSAVSWTVILTFLALIPFTLATSPSLPVDIMLNNFRVQEAGGNLKFLTTVSQDAYSIWPLVTYAAHGSSGLLRAFTPSSEPLVGSLTYQQVSQVLTLAAMLIVAGILAFWRRATEDPGGYLPLIALGIATFLMLLTGLVATHFLLALPFLLLCRRWMTTTAYLYVAVIWTVTTLVPMYGDMGYVLLSREYPLLAASNNAITRFFVGLYSWDRFITVGVVANICAVIWLAYLTFLPTAASAPARASPKT